jgi:NDP-sugar pyrophosphorylase family protein
MKGMIFAAGIGSRLKPFTDLHPKALVEVGGRPMLYHVIEHMATIGITDIVVNVHHFASQIIKYLVDNNNFGLNISISDESDRLLDTGGGLAKALPLLGYNDSILVHNADILTNVNLSDLIKVNDTTSDATMLCATRTSSRQLYADAHGRLCGWQNLTTTETKPAGFQPNGLQQVAFSGIQIVNPSLLPKLQTYAKGNDCFSIVPFYLDCLNTLDIRLYQASNPYQWFDVGKPQTLTAAREWICRS